MKTVEQQLAEWGGRAFMQEDPEEDDAFWISMSHVVRVTAARHRAEVSGPSEPRPLAIHFVMDMAPNARATICRASSGGAIDLVAVNTGLVELQSENLLGLLLQTDVLQRLGTFDADKAAELPTNVQIGLAGTSITALVLNFVVEHELAHLRNGHVDYLSALNHSSSEVLSEADMAAREIDLTRYALEFDADAAAVVAATVYGSMMVDSARPVPGKIVVAGMYRSHQLFARHLGFALTVFFWAQLGNISSPLGGPHHAAAHVRLGWCMATIETLEKLKRVPQGFSTAAAEGMADALRSIAQVRGEPVSVAALRAVLAEMNGPLRKAIAHEWARLHPHLVPLARGGKLAPPQPNIEI